MENLTYEWVASTSAATVLLLFIALFIIMLIYVFGYTSRDELEKAQRAALDLGQDQGKLGGRQ